MRMLLLIVAGAGVLVLGGGLWYWQGASRPAATFRTAAVERGDLRVTISATGTIEPEEVIDVGAQVAAQIKNFGTDPRDSSRPIDYGSPVHAGTLLAQLDDAPFQARVEEAEAAVAVAQSQVEAAEANVKRAEADVGQMQAKLVQSERDWVRAQKLAPSGALASVDVDTARATYETARANVGVDEAAIIQARAQKLQAEKTKLQAEASLREAHVNLGYTQIRSPVEGVIVDRRVNVGQTVVAGLNAPSLFLIAKDLKRLQVWAAVNEADVGNIHPGQTVRFTVDTYPKDTFVGQVAQVRLNASMTQNVVVYTVVVTTDNSDGRLLPYLTANLQFEVGRREDVVLVPNAALRWRPQPQEVAPEAREAYARLLHPRAAAVGDMARPQTEKEGLKRGTVWVEEGGFVKPVGVRPGLTDGAMTEVVDGNLQEGTPLVVGQEHEDAGSATSNPFVPKLPIRKRN